MSWSKIRPQLVSLLQTIPELQEVSGTPKVKFSGYPSAHVMPSDNVGDYETTKENTRTYAFLVRVFYETASSGVEGALEALEEVTDKVIDVLDKEDLKPSNTRVVGVSLDSDKTFLNIWAMPSRWGELPDEALLMSEITVKVRVSVDVS